MLDSPAPHGVGGLKLDNNLAFGLVLESHPSRGGWIEMRVFFGPLLGLQAPPRAGWGRLKYMERGYSLRQAVPIKEVLQTLFQPALTQQAGASRLLPI